MASLIFAKGYSAAADADLDPDAERAFRAPGRLATCRASPASARCAAGTGHADPEAGGAYRLPRQPKWI